MLNKILDLLIKIAPDKTWIGNEETWVVELQDFQFCVFRKLPLFKIRNIRTLHLIATYQEELEEKDGPVTRLRAVIEEAMRERDSQSLNNVYRVLGGNVEDAG